MSQIPGAGSWAVDAPVTRAFVAADGVRLDADVYYPRGTGPWPVLLMRQPYGREIASTVCYAHPAWYASHGYIVVIQDVRGRGTSGGVFRPFETERADGAASIEWAASLPGSSGVVGLYGFSYQGSNQLLAAAELPAPLRALAPAMLGWDLRGDWCCENDAPLLAGNIEWAVQLAGGNALRAGDRVLYLALAAAARTTPVHDEIPARPAVLAKARSLTHYFDWLDLPADAEYWSRISPHAQLRAALPQAPPALFVGGWFDTHLRGTLAAHSAFSEAGRDTRLIVGPWLHFPWGRRAGVLDFGEAAIGEVDQMQIRWFDFWLKGGADVPASWQALRLFDMGRCRWIDLAAWPRRSVQFFLDGSGRAALDERDGKLLPEAPERAGCDWIVHDPWRPAPAAGGPWGAPPGPADRALVDARPDVLTYTSAPLPHSLTVVGEPRLALDVQTEAPGFDLHAALSRVTADGRVIGITEGFRRFAVAPQRTAILPLRPTCITFAAGECIRLSVAVACFPAFAVHPGDDGSPSDARAGMLRVITLAALHGGPSSSALTLPVHEN